MRVIVTGSREYKDKERVRSILDKLYEESGDIELIHGLCSRGADWFAEEWAIDRQRGPDEYAKVILKHFPADWGKGKFAGPERNKRMIEYGADRVIAFFAPCPAKNRGTLGCVELARRAGIPVYIYGSISDPELF